MNKPRISLKPYIISGVISLVVGAIVFCLYFFIKGSQSSYGIIIGSDACLIAAAVLIAGAFFMFASREGFFDFVSYGFKQLGSTIFSKKPNVYNNYAEYRNNKNTVRKTLSKTYISVLIIGTAFLVCTLVLFIIYKSTPTK